MANGSIGLTDNPRELEVECRNGPNGGIIAPINGTCVPGFCPLGGFLNLTHAKTDFTGYQIAVDQGIMMECDKGYTIDGVATGPKSLQVRCDQDLILLPSLEDNQCKPVRCGEVSAHENSHIISNHIETQKLYFGDVVKYECDEGFYFQPPSINSPIPLGGTKFSFRCDSSGLLASVEDPSSIIPGKCVPANCPMPPDYPGADLVAKVTDRISVGQEVQYVCERGSSFTNSSFINLNAQKYLPSKTHFRVSCIWDSAEKVGIYDTDPNIARCTNDTSVGA